MCGKFTQMATWRQVYEYSNLLGSKVDDEVKTFTPMQSVPVVRLNQNGDRVTTPMVWGFTDRRSQGRRAPKSMHARGETVHQLRTWADAFQRRRGVTWVNMLISIRK